MLAWVFKLFLLINPTNFVTSCICCLSVFSSYVELLESFLRYTPVDHIDRKNLTHAIAKFKDLDGLFRQVKIKQSI